VKQIAIAGAGLTILPNLSFGALLNASSQQLILVLLEYVLEVLTI